MVQQLLHKRLELTGHRLLSEAQVVLLIARANDFQVVLISVSAGGWLPFLPCQCRQIKSRQQFVESAALVSIQTSKIHLGAQREASEAPAALEGDVWLVDRVSHYASIPTSCHAALTALTSTSPKVRLAARTVARAKARKRVVGLMRSSRSASYQIRPAFSAA